jgi:hypothetical protein
MYHTKLHIPTSETEFGKKEAFSEEHRRGNCVHLRVRCKRFDVISLLLLALRLPESDFDLHGSMITALVVLHHILRSHKAGGLTALHILCLRSSVVSVLFSLISE